MRMLPGLALILSVTMVSSCTDTEVPPAVAGPAVDAVSAATGTTAPIRAAEPGLRPPAEPAVTPHLLFPRGVRVTPNDYSIGPLQDLLAAAQPQLAVTGTLVAFLRALAEGAIAVEAVAPDRLRSLKRSLEYHLTPETLPHAARIGAIVLAEQEAHVVVRLFGDSGRVAGEIYLEAGAAGWRVVDVQLDLARLALPYTPREQQFAPSSDRWLLIR